MEDAIIEKIAIIKYEGYEKCPNCQSWTKPHRSSDGDYYECCSTYIG